jgi:hypothetical protein
VSDQNQILRLLATLREEMAAVRARQEELYEVLVSYKDQIQDLKQTVSDKLEGLPTSPYIAGQLVPAPDSTKGVDDFGQLLATYLHGAPPGNGDEDPVDVDMSPPEAPRPEDIELEPGDDPPRRRRGRSGRIDPDLSRGPDRDVVPLDLDEPKKKKAKKRRRSRSRKKKTSKKVKTDD